MDVQQAILGQVTRVADELAGIRQALERALSPVGETEIGCLHPEEHRIDFGGMGESDGFHCKACHQFIAPVKVTAHV